MRKFVLLVALAACADEPQRLDLRCDVAIIGGGAGGVHTAFRLAPTLKDGVCLFEKELVLGGRLHDIAKDPSDPASPVFGAGGMRLMEGQDGMFALASELGVTLQGPDTEGDFLYARGEFAYGKE